MSGFGWHLKSLRQRAGMTRPVLGELAGRSAGWVKAVETGRLQQPRLPMLIRLAEILGVEDLAELTGEQQLSRSTYGKTSHPDLTKIKTAVAAYSLTSQERPISIRDLAARVAQAWQLWHGARHQRSAVAAILPALLEDARAATRQLDGIERRHARASLSQVYHLAQLYLSFQPVPEIVVLTGDRAMNSAQDADNPHAIAAAAWYVSHVYRDVEESADARTRLALDATTLLQPERSSNDLALYGLLHLAVALSSAKVGHEGDAWRHWDKASKAARALGVGYQHPWLMFGQPVVDAYAVSIHTDLMQAGYALRQARKNNLGLIGSATRRSFHLTETARAHHLRQEYPAALALLGGAYAESPDTFGFSYFARAAVQDMRENGDKAVREGASRLAVTAGFGAA